jgi:hypothetical protein
MAKDKKGVKSPAAPDRAAASQGRVANSRLLKIDRLWVEADPSDPTSVTAWVYRDEGVKRAAVAFLFLYGLNLAELDNWIEAGTADGARQWLQWRARAIQAFEKHNADAMEAWAMFLRTAMHMIRVADFMQPLAKTGKARADQLSGFSDKGANARRKYTKAVKDHWRQLARSDGDIRRLCDSSKRQGAKKIAERCGLPPGAVSSIRKAI